MYALFKKERARLLSDSSKITYLAGLDFPQKMCYQPSYFDPMKGPSLSTHELPLYEDSSIRILIGEFGRNLPAKSLEGTEFERAAIVISDFSTEWIS